MMEEIFLPSHGLGRISCSFFGARQVIHVCRSAGAEGPTFSHSLAAAGRRDTRTRKLVRRQARKDSRGFGIHFRGVSTSSEDHSDVAHDAVDVKTRHVLALLTLCANNGRP
jgi:hypothetical protein